MRKFDTERIKLLSADDAELVKDCELEAQDAEDLGKELAAGKTDGSETLCSLGRDHDYTPYSPDVEENILYRLASWSLSLYHSDGARWCDACVRVLYENRVKDVFGSVSQRALNFLEEELKDKYSSSEWGVTPGSFCACGKQIQ